MENVFYALGVLFLWLEVTKIHDEKVHLKRMEETRSVEPSKWSKTTEYINNITLIYAGWMLAGIFSSQWPLFIVLFAQTILYGMLGNRSAKWMKIDALLSIIIILAIILNKYHFHYKFT